MNYTKSQEQAIRLQGQNILVSASAGSGKTGVLKERVIEKIRLGVDIDQLIILTFTEAAAQEMKNRIVKELIKLKLDEQLTKVDNAIISTFDAFTLRLVKEYHYLLKLDYNIQINDSVIIEVRKKETIMEVLKTFYQENSFEFNQFFKLYFSKSDAWLEEAVYKLGEDLRKLPNYQETIDNYENIYLNVDFMKEKCNEYLDDLISRIKKEYFIFIENYFQKSPLYDEKYQDYLSNIKINLEALLNNQGYDDFLDKVLNIDFPKKPSNKDQAKPEIIDYIKKEIIGKELGKLFANSYEDLVSNYKTIINSVKTLLKITKEYLKAFEVIKHEEQLYSFDDIMFFAIRLFKENPQIREKYQKKINEILIDEYQDTNDIQDQLISMIANNNIFMVGDVKQSIYRFRNANPHNFMRIYQDYLNSDNGKAIFLQENFRSNKYVLDMINKVFKQVMTVDFGGVDYQDEQVLTTGFSEDDQIQNQDAYEMILYDYKQESETDEEITKVKIESHLLAQDIKSKIGMEVYDLKLRRTRELNYQDFTILVDRKNDFLTISKIISQYNIPVDIYNDEPFHSSDEIRFVFQYLILINCFVGEEYFNKYFKTALFSVARSFVYKIKDEVITRFLIEQKLESKIDVHKLKEDESLVLIYNDIIDIISNYWDFPPYRILEAVYDKCQIYYKISYLDNPRQKEEKLDYFLMKVQSFTDFTYQDLLKYLQVIIENDEFDIEYSNVKKSVNAVKLMSIHKSKGLQFSHVYLIGLYKEFFNPENKDNFVFSKDYGILTKSYNQGFFPNFLQRLYFNRVEKENLSEKLRLLYVAMTRTINKLIVVMDYDEKSLDRTRKIRSFKDVFYQTLEINPDNIRELKILETQNKLVDDLKLNRKITFRSFNFENVKQTRAKYSKAISQIISDKTKEFIEFGEKYHLYLQNVDFTNLKDSIKDYPNDLQESIIKLSRSDIFLNLKSPKFYQEYQFYQEDNNSIFQGVIDLLIIDEDIAYIIDYKLKNLDDLSYIEQLRGYYLFLRPKIKKKIKIYLYSLLDSSLQEVNL